MTSSADIGTVRQALLDRFRTEVAVPQGIATDYEQMPSHKPGITAPWFRVTVETGPRDTTSGGSSLQVTHTGQLLVQVLVPISEGQHRALVLVGAVRAAFRAQVLASGIEILPEPAIVHVGRQDGRMRYDVAIGWRNLHVTDPGTDGAYEPHTLVSALDAAQELFAAEIEAPATGWAGLRTFYGNGPASNSLSLPWCAYYPKPLSPIDREHGPTELVPLRAIVVLHTVADRGWAGADAIVDRIVARHQQRCYRGVIFDTPNVVHVGRTPAVTWQTNIRLPFYIEEARP